MSVIKKKKTECFHFKKGGHIAKVCRTKQGIKNSKQTNHLNTGERERSNFLFIVQNMKSPGAITLELILNTVSVSMELDTVAALSLINTITYHKIRQLTTRSFNQVNYLSRNPDIMLRIYTGERINVHGSAEVEIYHEEKAEVLMLKVIEREGPNLLGHGWWNTLLVRLNGVCNLVGTIDKYVDEMLTKHIKVFSNELGTLTDYKAKLNVDSTVML